MAYTYDRRIVSKALNLEYWNLDKLVAGQPTTLYHGTTMSFRKFDLNKSRDDLVNRFYGRGLFFTPSKKVGRLYAEANRNIGFDKSIISDLSSKNRNAGEFLQYLYKYGQDGWEKYWQDKGFWNEDPAPGEGSVRLEEFEKHLGGVDSDTLQEIADYIIGSASKPLGDSGGGFVNIFSQSTGAPSWIYDSLDQVGLDSKAYRPKLYTVTVTVDNPLVTNRKASAKNARSKGYDSVIYHGPDLVQGVPEVAVFNANKVKIKRIEVLD